MQLKPRYSPPLVEDGDKTELSFGASYAILSLALALEASLSVYFGADDNPLIWEIDLTIPVFLCNPSSAFVVVTRFQGLGSKNAHTYRFFSC